MRSFALLVAVLLAGCATRLNATVQAFHTMNAAQSATYVFLASSEQASSLEGRAHFQRVRAGFADYGWKEAGSEQDAEFAVTLAYSLGDPTSQTTGTYVPYGSSAAVAVQRTTVLRRLKVTVLDNRKRLSGQTEPVYEVTVTSRGTTENLGTVMPYLVRAMFEEFPGRNGETRSYEYVMQ
jgi:hypothetical protein